MQTQLLFARLIMGTFLMLPIPAGSSVREPSAITAIVIHTIGGPACVGNVVQFRPIPEHADDAEFWRRTLSTVTNASAHYIIGRSGAMTQVKPLTEVARHTHGIDDISVGIELVHRGDGLEPFNESQILTLIDLIKNVRRQYPAIPLENIVAHSDIDQRTCSCAGVSYRRRQDPGANFPMQRVLNEVRTFEDATGRTSSLPRFSGPAAKKECVTERR